MKTGASSTAPRWKSGRLARLRDRFELLLGSGLNVLSQQREFRQCPRANLHRGLVQRDERDDTAINLVLLVLIFHRSPVLVWLRFLISRFDHLPLVLDLGVAEGLN